MNRECVERKPVVRVLATCLCALLASAAVAGGQAPPEFTKKPKVKRVAGKVRIEFAVDRYTDVAVYIEDAKGRVVRHLVAGVLGPNPPRPLKPNSLSQSIEWDGKADYGRQAGPGPFRVRVALGLGAHYDRVLMHDSQSLGQVKSLAVAPDGTLYVCCAFGAHVPNWLGERIVAISRDGTYLRTVLPWPSNLVARQVAGFGVHELDGRPTPLIHSVAQRRFHAGHTPRKAGMAATASGVLLRPVGGDMAGAPPSISAIGISGAAPWGSEGGPRLLPQHKRLKFTRPFIAVSPDGKCAYLAGMGDRRLDRKPGWVSFSSVYRVKLPERSPAEPFFGEPEEPGNDESHLCDAPRGLAVDGKGRLLIADHKNDRVVVVGEQDGRFLGSFAVKRPDCLGVDPATDAVYVTRVPGRQSVELVKFRSWQEPKVLAKLAVKSEGNPDFPWVMSLDASARPPVVWMGSDRGSLLRIEDTGTRFERKKVNTDKFGNSAFVDISVDRFRPDKEIYVRCGQGNWYRYNEEKDKITRVRIALPSAAGSCLTAGPDGNLYLPAYPYHLLRFTRDGKPLPWPEADTRYPPRAMGKRGKLETVSGPRHGVYVPVSMTFMTHTLGVRHDGHIFMFQPGHHGGRPPKMLIEYLPSGRRVGQPIIWMVSDTAIGPRFDQEGNIYIAEQIKPLGQPYPQEFVKLFGELRLEPDNTRSKPVSGGREQVATMYGSIVKFTPKGGMIRFGGERPFQGKPEPDPSLKSVLATSFHGRRLYPTRATGAEWIRMGISHVDIIYCNCENTRFDVDEFGRVWYPDLGRFRVGVLDTNGNEITHFGGYGNADSSGPESKDPALAKPDIAFAWLIGVAATDRYAYMGDSMNRRLLRAKLVYAAEETCPIPR